MIRISEAKLQRNKYMQHLIAEGYYKFDGFDVLTGELVYVK